MPGHFPGQAPKAPSYWLSDWNSSIGFHTARTPIMLNTIEVATSTKIAINTTFLSILPSSYWASDDAQGK